MKRQDRLYIPKALVIGKLALVFVLGYVATSIVLFPKHQEAGLGPTQVLGRDRVHANEMTSPPELSLEDYTEIIERNPFGGSSKWASIANGSKHSVSEELGLALFGTISGNPVVARAIIKDLKTGVLDVYITGQTVGDARIESIDTDAVILTHNGERIILRLNITQSGSYSSDNTQTSSPQTINKSGAVRTDLSTQKIGTDVRTEIGRVEAVLSKANIKPYAVDDQIEGLRITGLENISEAKELGLQNGDIIRVVNGHRLTDKQKAFQIFKKARSQASVSMELLRDNETKTLTFPLR